MFAHQQHSELHSSLEAIGTSVAVFERTLDGSFVLVSANSIFGDLLSMEIPAAVGKALTEIWPRYAVQVLKPSFLRCVSDQAPTELELALDSAGVTAWWRVLLSPVFGGQRGVTRLIMTAIDITSKKELERALESSRIRFQALVDSAYDGIVSINDAQEIKLMNPAARDMFGISPEDPVEGTLLEALLPQRYRKRHEQYLGSFKASPVASRPMHSRAAVVGLHRSGHEFPIEVTIAKIRVGEATEMTAVLRDISERARLIEELKVAATTDPLTGCANRRRLGEMLAHELQRCRRFNHRFSLLMVDIDHFKRINDGHGHPAGDGVLTGLADRLKKCVRDVDLVGRWGGEEFLVLLPETDQVAASECAERIRATIADSPFEHDGLKLEVTVSIGVTTSNCTMKGTDNPVERVDRALYAAKEAGRNRVVCG